MSTREEKARRMAIRKDLGNRPRVSEDAKRATGVIPKLRGPDYLVAHACFECRKSYKYSVSSDNKPTCPQCSGPLSEMGRAFKAPKKNELSQWKKVKKLRDAGYRFVSHSSAPVEYPRSLKEVDDFIKAYPRHKFRLKEHWP